MFIYILHGRASDSEDGPEKLRPHVGVCSGGIWPQQVA